MDNLQKLLDYQTQYLLWAIGTVLNPGTKVSETLEADVLPSEMLQELREVPRKQGNKGARTMDLPIGW